ncbi:rhombosortase [Alcanivorax sediminis]|uniref:Rhombosortase n=1 Tax=Alcanivorax sediminis TaxID=2663008 RepID=A0A6N7M2V9_9GAMM|nr:rhombosortase [Alcanivorax sediminis]MQX54490.1 rhombosortase [Alcanivorax sediminis]
MQPRDKKLRPQFIAFAVVLAVLGIEHQFLNPWLAFDRAAIEAGQVWRVFTCHLVHLNSWHLLLNLSGLVLCGYFFEDLLDRFRFWAWLIFCGLTSGLALYFIDGQLMHYVGLSGILHGLLILCLLLGWRGNPVLHSVVLAVIVGRMISEHLPGYDVDYLQNWINGRVYVNAHLYGAISGVALWGFIKGGEWFVGQREQTE